MDEKLFNRISRINNDRATLNLNKRYQTKDSKLYFILETAREKWFRGKLYQLTH